MLSERGGAEEAGCRGRLPKQKRLREAQAEEAPAAEARGPAEEKKQSRTPSSQVRRPMERSEPSYPGGGPSE